MVACLWAITRVQYASFHQPPQTKAQLIRGQSKECAVQNNSCFYNPLSITFLRWTWLGNIKKYIKCSWWLDLISSNYHHWKLLKLSNQKNKPVWVTQALWIGKENRPEMQLGKFRAVSWSFLSLDIHAGTYTQESEVQDRACPRQLEELLTTGSCLDK